MDIKDYYTFNDEKPLDRIVDDGGFVKIFRKIAYVGDSLSSGEFEAINKEFEFTWHDMFEYSWGQYIARTCGNIGYNFSRGGMTAKEYCESFAQSNDYWNKEKACQAYVIALGVNDVLNARMEIGTTDDICLDDYTKNKQNFIGYYAQIIQRYKEIQPNAKFFLVTMARHFNKKWANDELIEKHKDVLYSLSAIFKNVYVIDLCTYLPEYTKEFWDLYGLHSHMNPMGYVFTAKVISSYMDYIIRHNMKDFKQVALIGTDMYDENLDK